MAFADIMADHEFRNNIKEFISANFEEDPKLTNLADIIIWNEEHAQEAMPAREFFPLPSMFLRRTADKTVSAYTTQTEIIKSLNSTMTKENTTPL